MSQLVIDPGSVSVAFRTASVSNPKRIRIIAQVVDYSNGFLTIGGIPGLSPANSQLQVKVDLILLSHELTYAGSIVNIEAFYDGDTVNVFDCFPINGECLLDKSYLATLQEMAALQQTWSPGNEVPK